LVACGRLACFALLGQAPLGHVPDIHVCVFGYMLILRQAAQDVVWFHGCMCRVQTWLHVCLFGRLHTAEVWLPLSSHGMVTTWRYNRVEMDTRGLVTSAYSNLITKMIIITAMAKIHMLSTINQI
jgi:hypothetical protein